MTALTCQPHWTAYVLAVGTPVVALIAALFGGLIAGSYQSRNVLHILSGFALI